MPRRLLTACLAVLVATGVLVAGPAILPPAGPPGGDPGEATLPSLGSMAPPSLAPTPEPTRPVLVIARRPPTASEHLGARLQAHLDALRETAGIPGISAAVEFSDGTVWSGVSGLADVAAGIPVTTDTAFSFASMTKTFVAAIVLDLAFEGRFALDTPVVELLPDVAVDERITVHHLLDHSSGLHDYFLAPGIDPALQGDRAAAWTHQQALAWVRRPYFEPGTGWRYSNTNYLLLGMIVERVTGSDLAVALRTRFLDPIGLRHTYVQALEAPRGPVSRGYRFRGSDAGEPAIDLSDGSPIMPFTSVVTAAGGAGSMAGTAADAARWARRLYGGDVLHPDALALMVGDVEVVAGYRPPLPYGLGVQAYKIDGHATLGHSGRFLGYRGAMRYVVGEDVSIAVLTNQSRSDPGAIVRALLAVALPDPGCFDCPSAR